MAALAETVGQLELAARLLGAVDYANGKILRLYPVERADYDRLVEAVWSRQGPARFDAAWALGREERFDQIALEALLILEAAVRAREQGSSS